MFARIIESLRHRNTHRQRMKEDKRPSSVDQDDVVFPQDSDTTRRRSSLFGYSTNAADDYMQKDLLSSSWS
ncbi:hypothetical protein [Absidia glauca]|uniref:Uncharacterized protein n=1 Tax=Absidia glauca TaxID=4829 RepID=A0A163J7V2_ABSGL|nr:hypothetical protein [Absidia glauca]